LPDVPTVPSKLAEHPVYRGIVKQAAALLAKIQKKDSQMIESSLIISFINVYTIQDSDSAPGHRDLVTKYGTVVFVIEQEGTSTFQVSRDPMDGKVTPRWTDIAVEQCDGVGFVSDLTHQYLHHSSTKRVSLNLFF
jgi:hypothetical protein